MSKRILLTEEDFEILISGGVIKKDDVEIALQDIGYNVMFEAISREILKEKMK